MTTKAITTAGTLIGISSSLPATYDNAGFAALSYNTIAEVLDLGEFGKSYNLVKLNTLGDRKTYKFRGSYDNGSMSIKLAKATLVNTDVGQAAANTANNSDASVSFRVTNQDGSKDYFTAKILSFTTTVGTVDTILMGNLKIEIDSDVVSNIS